MSYDLPSHGEIESFFRRIPYSVGNAVLREAHNSGTYTKSGVKYKSLPNRSSAPYQSFARQTGQLSDSLDVEVKGLDVYVGSDVDYLKYLEEGTKHMSPRPTLKLAYDSSDIVGVIDKEVKKMFR